MDGWLSIRVLVRWRKYSLMIITHGLMWIIHPTRIILYNYNIFIPTSQVYTHLGSIHVQLVNVSNNAFACDNIFNGWEWPNGKVTLYCTSPKHNRKPNEQLKNLFGQTSFPITLTKSQPLPINLLNNSWLNVYCW